MRTGLSIAVALIASLVFIAQPGYAQPPTPRQQTTTSGDSDMGIQKLLQDLAGLFAQTVKPGDINVFFLERIALIINFMLAMAGATAVIMGVISGYMYMTAYGNEERAAAAKRNIFYTAIGLAVVFAVWTILTLFTTFVGTAGRSDAPNILNLP